MTDYLAAESGDLLDCENGDNLILEAGAPAAPTYRKLVVCTVSTRITDLAGWLAAILIGANAR